LQPAKGSTDLNWWKERLLPWTLSFGRSLALMLVSIAIVLPLAIVHGAWSTMAAVFRGLPSRAAQSILQREIVPPLVFVCDGFAVVVLIAALDFWRFLRLPSRPDRLRNRLRFDGFLLLKSAGALAGLAGVWLIMRDPAARAAGPRASGEALTAWFWLVGLAVVAVVYWSLLDQRYRCRVCLRRLRMPVPTGSWSTPLLDRPSTEYICPFGHGKVNVAAFRMFGMEPAHWTYYGDFWHELVDKEHAAHED
jgi:hypothetical protein